MHHYHFTSVRSFAVIGASVLGFLLISACMPISPSPANNSAATTSNTTEEKATTDKTVENMVMEIATARSQPISSTVTVAGTAIIAAGDFESSTYDKGFALQDASGGIYVSLADDTGVKLGEQIEVTGELQEPNGLVTVVVTDPFLVKHIGAGESITPEVVKTGDVNDTTEGRLVAIEGMVNQAVFDDLPYGYKFYVDDGSGEIQVFVSASSKLDLSKIVLEQPVRIVGFSGQYAATYEVQPRLQDDIVILE